MRTGKDEGGDEGVEHGAAALVHSNRCAGKVAVKSGLATLIR